MLSRRFRWVFCQLEVLRLCFPANLRRTLEELPKSLDDTYKRILNEINNANQVHAYRLLQCIAVALRPLRVEELAEVLAFDLTTGGMPKLNAAWRWEDQEEAVLSACSSLVSVITDDGSRVVQFSHFSVKEFLTSDRLASCMEEISQFHIPVEPSHAVLAQTCLGVLLCLDDRADEDNVKEIPLYHYATEYWAAHTLVENVELQIKDTLDYFFDMDNPHFSALARLVHEYKLLRVSGDEQPTGVPRPAAPLYFAAWMGLRGLVERLIIKDPQQVTQLGGIYGTPLHASVLGGHFEGFQLLFAHGADINSRSANNWTPFHISSSEGHMEIGKWLLDHGADVNSRTDKGWTPLHLAAYYGHLQACRVLLERNAEVNSWSHNGSTPLLRTLESGCADVARLLLDHNADVRTNNEEGDTPLHFAAFHQHLDVCRILLERNAEVDSRNNDGSTPFLKAWLNEKNSDILQLFLEHNANMHVCDERGNTPLHLAAEKGLFKVAQILLERDAEVDSRNQDGYTSLLFAIANGNPKVAQLLLDYNAEVHVQDNTGNTPLHFAAENGLLEISQIILERNAGVNSQNNRGSTPLLLASELGHPDVVQLLLDHDADLSVRNTDGDTPLHRAAHRGQLEVARILLKLDAEVNSRNVSGSTPLHLASMSSFFRPEGSAVVVQLLLDYGADVQVRDLSGNTASQLACRPEQQDIIRLLSQHAVE
jgi:ankyrin repeat protein